MQRRYRLDHQTERHGRVVVGGSPLKLFRLTDSGADAVRRLDAGELIDESPLVVTLLEAGAIHPVETSATRFGSADVTIVVPALGAAPHAPDGAIVVDDASNPPLPGATIRLAATRGPAAARNAGLVRVSTPLVAFVDTDVVVPDGWLDRLLHHFDDDRVALVAPRVRSRPGTSGVARYEASGSPLDLGHEPARIRAGSRVGYVPAAAIVCRVDALRDIGGFDEELRFGEDVDMVWRLDAAGWRLRYDPAVSVAHEPRPDWPGWVRQRIGYGSSAAPLARRHPGAVAPLRLSAWSIGAWWSGVAVHPLVGISIAAGSAAALVRKLPDVPRNAAFRLGWRGNLLAGGQLAEAIRRAWWPVLAVAALRSRTARRALVLAVLNAGHPIKAADDVAYSVGVWRGIARERTAAPLVPDVSSWPGRRRPPRRADAR